MKKLTLQSLFTGALCASALFLLASCSQTSDYDSALPETGTRAALTNMENGPFRLEFYDLPSPVFPSQRITFRVYYNELHSYGYGDHQLVNIRVYDPATGKDLSLNDKPGFYQYYFFTGSARAYLIELTLASDPTIKAVFPIDVKPGIYLKLVDRERWLYQSDATNGEVYLAAPVIQFFTDETCTERILSLPDDMRIRVHLEKRAVELFSPDKAHYYRDEDVFVPIGSSEACSYRLYTAHQITPSGEHLDDFYEIEFLGFY